MNPLSDAACVYVLVVSPFESDHIALAHIFGHTAWRFESARSLREAQPRLMGNCAPVVLCEENLPDGSWKDLLSLKGIEDPYQIIVTSQQADERLWAEVLNLGAYDVLAKPFHSKEVFRTVGQAWRQLTSVRKPPARVYREPKTIGAGAVA